VARRNPDDAGTSTRAGRPPPGGRPLTVVVVTQEDPFYIPHFFRSFCRGLADHADRIVVREVVIQPSFGESTSQLARRMLEFYGWGDFLRLLARYGRHKARLALENLGIGKAPASIAGICRAHGIAVRAEPDVNRKAFVEHVRQAGTDLIVSVSAPQIFQQDLLEAPRHGCINIHNGRLPEYRGMLPNFWQMLNGEKSSITTIHAMVRKLDAGTVLWEEATPIRAEMSLDALIRETKKRSADALWRVLEYLAERQELPLLRQIEGEGGYYSFPKSRHAQQLRGRGHALL
jgi:methionyl-tRNA formyltransferase